MVILTVMGTQKIMSLAIDMLSFKCQRDIQVEIFYSQKWGLGEPMGINFSFAPLHILHSSFTFLFHLATQSYELFTSVPYDLILHIKNIWIHVKLPSFPQ